MSDTFVEIKDKSGNTFRMKFSRPTSKFMIVKYPQIWKRMLTSGGWFGGSVAGNWKTLDEGFIRYHAGKTRTRFSENGDLTTSDLIITGSEGIKTFDGPDVFGMQLFEYEDIWGPNSRGEGIVIQPWVINLAPGRINWRRL
jgi:hypothetical protein